MLRSFAVFAAVLFLAGLATARAETVCVIPFELKSDEVAMPCDLESVISARLAELGCDVLPNAEMDTPDIIVTGTLWQDGGNTFATVKISDTVSGQVTGGQNLYLPADERACVELAEKVATEIDSPPIWAKKLNFKDGATGMEFAYIPAGTFRMSQVRGAASHKIVNAFFIARHEVTQAQWTKVMGSNPSIFTGDPNLPVENVSWMDAQEFVRKLNEKTGRRYRLPTEAEWEYAARTRGRNFTWSGTSRAENLDNYAWTKTNSGGGTHPVGTRRANGLGIFDMCGNVWEWTSDRYKGRSDDGMSGERKIIKGGSWMMDATYSAISLSEPSSPESRYQDNGFRLVLEPLPEQAPKPVASVAAPK